MGCSYLTSVTNAPEFPFKITKKTIWDSLVNTVQRAMPSLKNIDRKYMMTTRSAYACLQNYT